MRKAKGMELIFARFDSQKSLWAAASTATALLDALGSLAMFAAKPGMVRANIVNCPRDGQPGIRIVQGRHPCVETSINMEEFVPNDLSLGTSCQDDPARVLLLSGPNMVSLILRAPILTSSLSPLLTKSRVPRAAKAPSYDKLVLS